MDEAMKRILFATIVWFSVYNSICGSWIFKISYFLFISIQFTEDKKEKSWQISTTFKIYEVLHNGSRGE